MTSNENNTQPINAVDDCIPKGADMRNEVEDESVSSETFCLAVEAVVTVVLCLKVDSLWSFNWSTRTPIALGDGGPSGSNSSVFTLGLAVGRPEDFIAGPDDGRTVGPDVGFTVGFTVGPDDGFMLGTDVGFLVGIAVGPDVGFMLGTDVGFLVGIDVGLDVGLLVGIAVGTYVGRSVGIDVGDGVGFVVGFTVGLVGFELGFVVGRLLIGIDDGGFVFA